MIELIWNWIQ